MTTEIEVPQTMHIEATEKPETPENPSEIPNPNKDIMDAIYEKRKQRLLAEEATQLGEELKPVETPAEVLPEEQSAEPAAAPLTAEVATPPTTDPAAGAKLPDKITLKVEQRDIDVPMDTLVTLAQKGLSSTKAWEEAAQMKREAQELMFSMKQNMQPQAAPENTPQKTSLSDIVEDVAERINYGSKDDQKKALLDYGAAIKADLEGRSQGLPPEQLVQVATQNAISAIKFEQDQATIAKEFPEVFRDKHLSQLAGNIAGEKVQQAKETGAYKPLVDIWRDALTEVKSKYIPVQSAPSVQAASKVVDMTDKVERKRAAPQPPAAVNRIATEKPPQYGVDPSSIIAKMRKARGQPVY